MARLGGVLVSVALAATTATACSTEGMAFRVDDSIEFVAPAARATVALPLTVRWRDDEPPTGRESYAAFVDRAPIRPNARLKGDETALRDRGVIRTTTPRVTLEFLEDLRPTSRGTSKDPHEVTVVRMRGNRRVGEAAFRLSFFVDRGNR